MTRVFITTTARVTPWFPYAHSNYLRVVWAAEAGDRRNYQIAEHPTDADVVLFIAPQRLYQSDIRCEPLFREFKNKAMVLDFFDNPKPLIPGLYVGLNERNRHCAAYQGGYYVRVADNRMLDSLNSTSHDRDLLFSFQGKVANCPGVRGRVAVLSHPRGLVLDRWSSQSDNDSDYVRTIGRSKFVLAPRGVGPSSWRLFETMKAGRVPVIISDNWVPPRGVRWEDFSVRVPEAEIETIPARLEALESKSAEMGLRARREWVKCFSYENVFAWIVDRLDEIAASVAEHGGGESTAFGYFRAGGLREKFDIVRESIAARRW